MKDTDKVAKIIRYLVDLADISTEHANSCKTCWNPEKSGECMIRATISVEITTYRIKLRKFV